MLSRWIINPIEMNFNDVKISINISVNYPPTQRSKNRRSNRLSIQLLQSNRKRNIGTLRQGEFNNKVITYRST